MKRYLAAALLLTGCTTVSPEQESRSAGEAGAGAAQERIEPVELKEGTSFTAPAFAWEAHTTLASFKLPSEDVSRGRVTAGSFTAGDDEAALAGNLLAFRSFDGDEFRTAPFQAEEEAAGPPVPEGMSPLSLRGGIGFTLDPDTFLLTAEADYHVEEQITVGPLVQLGIDDNRTIVAPSVNVQYIFDLSGVSEGEFADLKPFVQGGAGVAYIHRDRRFGDDDDVGFLFNFGFGAEYEFSERFALGNNLLFNILPDDVNNENFFFSWQFVTFRYRF